MSDTYDKKQYTYFITGGGTGGHIYPAIAVCDALRADNSTKEIYYIGNPDNLEYEIVKKMGYKFLPIKVSGMPRKMSLGGLFGFIKWGIELELANWKALFYLYKYKPDAILGTGGYVSAPALFAGSIAGVPFMIHDSDAQPGIVSKYVAPTAKCVSVAFDGAREHLKNKEIQTNGNPIRENFKTLTKTDARKNMGLADKKTICVMGGSQGAKSINDAVIPNLKKLSQENNLQIIFQTGTRNYEEVLNALKEAYPQFEEDKNLVIKPYFDDMVSVLKSSDIAISRAGSLSLSEICASEVVSILVPYPHAAADHQRKNARFMVKKHASLYLEDKDTNQDTILAKIEKLLTDEEKFETMKQNAKSLAKLNATKSIVEQLKSIIKS